MSYIVDRRLNGKNKSTVNRQRFLNRYRKHIKKAVDDTGKAKWGEKYDSLKESGSLRLPFRTDRLKEKGYQFLSDAPSPGAHGCQVIFIHPKSCDGVLIELNQPSDDHHH